MRKLYICSAVIGVVALGIAVPPSLASIKRPMH